jgi:hypothetical protein
MKPSETTLSFSLVLKWVAFPFVKAWEGYTFALNTAYEVLSWHVSYAAKVINLFLNLQWVDTLNIFQNIGYNMYMADSRGNRSIHASMLLFSAIIAGVTMYAEIWKFIVWRDFQFSTGFYAALTLLLGIVQLAFTQRENQKTKAEMLYSEKIEPEEDKSISEVKVVSKKKIIR